MDDVKVKVLRGGNKNAAVAIYGYIAEPFAAPKRVLELKDIGESLVGLRLDACYFTIREKAGVILDWGDFPITMEGKGEFKFGAVGGLNTPREPPWTGATLSLFGGDAKTRRPFLVLLDLEVQR